MPLSYPVADRSTPERVAKRGETGHARSDSVTGDTPRQSPGPCRGAPTLVVAPHRMRLRGLNYLRPVQIRRRDVLADLLEDAGLHVRLRERRVHARPGQVGHPLGVQPEQVRGDLVLA